MEKRLKLWVGKHIYADSGVTLEDLFRRGDSTLLVRNQEEKDYFSGMQLMFGKTADIMTLDEWKQRKRMYQVTSHYKRTEAPLKLPYTVFTTFDIMYANFD